MTLINKEVEVKEVIDMYLDMGYIETEEYVFTTTCENGIFIRNKNTSEIECYFVPKSSVYSDKEEVEALKIIEILREKGFSSFLD